MLAVPCSKFQVESARWHWCSKERCQDHVQKFRSYCPTTADFYPKLKNAGWKPGYPTRERHENPIVIFNRIKGDKETAPVCIKWKIMSKA